MRYFALLAAVVMIAAACKRTEPPEPTNNLLGSWETTMNGADYHSFTFTDKMEYDYTGYYGSENGIYSTDKADLSLTPAISGASERVLSFELVGGRLTLRGLITHTSAISQTVILQKK